MAISLGSCRLFTMQISSSSLINYSRCFGEGKKGTWARFELELWPHSLPNFSAPLPETMPLSSIACFLQTHDLEPVLTCQALCTAASLIKLTPSTGSLFPAPGRIRICTFQSCLSGGVRMSETDSDDYAVRRGRQMGLTSQQTLTV